MKKKYISFDDLPLILKVKDVFEVLSISLIIALSHLDRSDTFGRADPI